VEPYFWGTSEQNQRMYYYHLFILQNQFLLHVEGNLPGLTTEEWRSILGNTYWKSMWPRLNAGDAGSSNFDPVQFWIKGGPLFFGDKLSTKVAFGHEVAFVLHCHCEVQMDMADDDEIQQTLLYHLNMDHVSAEIKEMDRLQFGLDYERRNQGRLSPILDMMDMWGPIRDGGVNSGFFADKKA